jgi:hypothetical protein
VVGLVAAAVVNSAVAKVHGNVVVIPQTETVFIDTVDKEVTSAVVAAAIAVVNAFVGAGHMSVGRARAFGGVGA